MAYDARFDAVFPGVLASMGVDSRAELLDDLEPALRALPLERREHLVLSPRQLSHGVLWRFVALAPTATVCGPVLLALEGAQRGHVASMRDGWSRALHALAEAGHGAALASWLGRMLALKSRTPARPFVLRALGGLGEAPHAALFLDFAADSDAATREAALVALRRLGEGARPALESARTGKKAKLKPVAEQLLAELDGVSPTSA